MYCPSSVGSPQAFAACMPVHTYLAWGASITTACQPLPNEHCSRCYCQVLTATPPHHPQHVRYAGVYYVVPAKCTTQSALHTDHSTAMQTLCAQTCALNTALCLLVLPNQSWRWCAAMLARPCATP